MLLLQIPQRTTLQEYFIHDTIPSYFPYLTA